MTKRAKADSSNPKDSLGALKVPLDLTMGVAQIWWALAQADGAAKYGEKNWRNKAVRMSVYIAAIKRHNMQLEAGEDVDRKSGIPHTGHIMACAAIIEDARAAGCLIDDRREKDGAAALLELLTADNYDASTLKLTRTPARTLGEIHGGPMLTATMAKLFLDKRAADAAKAAKAARAAKRG